jgi:hypothetical protein
MAPLIKDGKRYTAAQYLEKEITLLRGKVSELEVQNIILEEKSIDLKVICVSFLHYRLINFCSIISDNSLYMIGDWR